MEAFNTKLLTQIRLFGLIDIQKCLNYFWKAHDFGVWIYSCNVIEGIWPHSLLDYFGDFPKQS